MSAASAVRRGNALVIRAAALHRRALRSLRGDMRALARDPKDRAALRRIKAHLASALRAQRALIDAGRRDASALGRAGAVRELRRAAGKGADIRQPVRPAIVAGRMSHGLQLARHLAGHQHTSLLAAAMRRVRNAAKDGREPSTPRQREARLGLALGRTSSRLALIARTETMAAYRAELTATFAANPHLLRGWQWCSLLSASTCSFCRSRHGTIFPLDSPFSSHPGCRCSPIPIARTP